MSDQGFKVSVEGKDVTRAQLADLVVNSTYPNWKCDMRPSPKHYGSIELRIGSFPAGVIQTVYTVPHGYDYRPSFIVAWSKPTGIDPGHILSSKDTTYGIGDIEVYDAGFNLYYIKSAVDETTFTIAIDNAFGGTLTPTTIFLRYYIFADDFEEYNYLPITLRTIA